MPRPTGRIIETSGFLAVCYISATMASSVIVLAFYRPAALFPDERATPLNRKKESSIHAFGSLFLNRAALIAALVSLLWEFDPGWRTPLSITTRTRWGSRRHSMSSPTASARPAACCRRPSTASFASSSRAES